MEIKNTIVYFDGGEDYKGQFELTRSMRNKWHQKAFENGHDGYLTGYRYLDGRKDSVLVYFKTRPSEEEITKRRKNGFLSAKWVYLSSVTKAKIGFALNIAKTFNNESEMVATIRHIANLIEEGYTFGHDPDWSIKE